MKTGAVRQTQRFSKVGLEAPHKIQFQTGRGALDFLRRRTVLLDLLEDGIGRLLEFAQRMAWTRCDGNLEDTCVFVAILACPDGCGCLLIVNKSFGKSRRSGTCGNCVKDL